MKKLITIMSILMFSTTYGGNLINNLFKTQNSNPNGHPFTLNISSVFVDADNASFHFRTEINLPINSWLTIKGGKFEDRDTHRGYDKEGDILTPVKVNNHKIFYTGVEIHLPVYKIWNKN